MRGHNTVMRLKMTNSSSLSIRQIEKTINNLSGVKFETLSKKEAYEWIRKLLRKVKYRRLSKQQKGEVLEYLRTFTGYDYDWVKRLVQKYRHNQLYVGKYERKNGFSRKYRKEDKALLYETRRLHNEMSGKAIKKIMEDEDAIFMHHEYGNIKKISVSYIYKLLGRKGERARATTFYGTRPIQMQLGKRAALTSDGRPGHINVDTVHQGDKDGEKGIYHINMVDALTQYEFVGSVGAISEAFLTPLLEAMLAEFPYTIIEFHADNGSEYINKIVVRLLNKLNIALLKSRPKQTTDNAQVESKNGSVIRKHMGYIHIQKEYAPLVNTFYDEFFNEYLNFHRPCAFPTEIITKKGKVKKVYNTYFTPYQKLKEVDPTGMCLKSGITYAILDSIERKMSHNEAAKLMNKEKLKLFKKVFNL